LAKVQKKSFQLTGKLEIERKKKKLVSGARGITTGLDRGSC